MKQVVDFRTVIVVGAALGVGWCVGFFTGRASVKGGSRKNVEEKAYESGEVAAEQFRRGFAEGMEKILTTPIPPRLTGQQLKWLEEISKLPADRIGPSKLMALFHPQGYYQQVRNMTKAQSEKIFSDNYKGKRMPPWTVYVTDVTEYSIEGIWAIQGELKIRVTARFPFRDGKPDLTMINKGEVWRLQGQLENAFWNLASFSLSDTHIVSRVDVPSTWTLGTPLLVQPAMETVSQK